MSLSEKKLLLAAWACRSERYGSGQLSEAILRKLFGSVLVFDTQEVSYAYGKEEMNRRLIELVKKEQPDYVFFWLIYDEIAIDTLLRVREVSPKTKLVNFFGDDDSLYESYSRFIAPLMDGCFMVQLRALKSYRRDSIKNVFRLCGVDTSLYRPLPYEKTYDVSFIGTPKTDRYEFIRYLVAHGIDVTLFGSGWERYPELRKQWRGPLTKEDVIRVINESRINLSFTKNNEMRLHYKGRVAEVNACCSFLITEAYEGYAKLFHTNELVMFRDKEDLLRKVKHYLKHEAEREEIAKRAYRRVVRELSLEKEMREAFLALEKKKSKKTIALPSVKKSSTVYLSRADLLLKHSGLVRKIGRAQYIGFAERGSKALPHKDAFQIASLTQSKKEISCCDYYVHSPALGDYLALQTKYASRVEHPRIFSQLVVPEQLMVRKVYALKHLAEFRRFVRDEICPFPKETFAFVSLPLIRIEKAPPISAQGIGTYFLPKYEDRLRALHTQKKLFTSPYLYQLVLYALFRGFPLLRYGFRRLKGKMLSLFPR